MCEDLLSVSVLSGFLELWWTQGLCESPSVTFEPSLSPCASLPSPPLFLCHSAVLSQPPLSRFLLCLLPVPVQQGVFHNAELLGPFRKVKLYPWLAVSWHSRCLHPACVMGPGVPPPPHPRTDTWTFVDAASLERFNFLVLVSEESDVESPALPSWVEWHVLPTTPDSPVHTTATWIQYIWKMWCSPPAPQALNNHSLCAVDLSPRNACMCCF